ncbi:MAG: hypothetical protein R3263_10285 [Myxococcota bacterium]|nr:hypothetical protein [Myxococcota bacterium]
MTPPRRIPGSHPRLPAWRAAVGAPVVLRGAAAPGGDGARRLAVATWNVHVGGGDLPRFLRDLRGGALTADRPDDAIVLLQEVHRTDDALPAFAAHPHARGAARIEAAPPAGARIDVVEVARRVGDVDLFYAPSMRNGTADAEQPPEDRGNAIVSTLPLRDLVEIELPAEVQRRVAVGAALPVAPEADAAGPALAVASAHLDTFDWTQLHRNLGAFRAVQAEALARGLAAWRGGPAILGGGFNTWARGTREPAVRLRARAFGPLAPGSSRPTSPLPGPLPARRIDLFFVRGLAEDAFRYERVADRYGSDHHPLVGTLRVRATPGAAPREGV